MATENKYYKRNEVTGAPICIHHGEQGYYPLTQKDTSDDVIRAMNKILGNTPNMVNAAETCSMFDIWDKFDAIVEKLDMIDKVMH